MIGIRAIASYIPNDKVFNLDRANKFELEERFLEKKVGILSTSRKRKDETISDMCCAAFDQLVKINCIDINAVQVIVVCTQNPDTNIPHASAIVHGRLNFQERCAAFDLSLGCSGYVYGLSIIENMMKGNGFTSGLFFTCDPYSKIINENDRNTALIFGDAATVTHIGIDPIFSTGHFSFGTRGKESDSLFCRNGVLHMNGRAIFAFAASTVIEDIWNALNINGLKISDIDCFLIHQGSKYIVDFIRKKLQISDGKAPFSAQAYGNTVSSSIPLLLEERIADPSMKKVLITGFGVGLSWASTVLFRVP